MAECDVTVRPTAKVTFMWAFERLRVSVPGGEAEPDEVSWNEVVPIEGFRGCNGTTQYVNGREIPEQLFDSGWHHVWAVSKRLEHTRVRGEVVEPVGNDVDCGVASGGECDVRKAEHLFPGKGPAVELGSRYPAEKVFARIRLSFVDTLLEVRIHSLIREVLVDGV